MWLVVMLLVPITLASAGGWATITVEELPEYVVAGQPAELTFTIRQHGVSPMDELAPVVEAKSASRKATFPARPGKTPGEYYVPLTVPEAGEWKVTINSGFGPSKVTLMPIRTIARGAPVPAPLSDFDRGHSLFVAKGCVTCHTHAKVPGSGAVKAGPDLTMPRLAGDYLTKFLADPSITPPRGDMRMPNLNLDAKEIHALVAFIAPEKPVK
jgi:mono/diheme cytochrome c family protein